MKRTIRTQHWINASKKVVWSVISDPLGWENWFPIVHSTRIDGVHRELTLNNEDIFREFFLTSAAQSIVVYHVYEQKSFPAEDLTGVLRLTENGNSTVLDWTLELEVESEEILKALEKQVMDLYETSARSIEKLIEEGVEQAG